MTSRERILAALNHQETERIPVDFGGHRSSGIMAIAYKHLKEYLGISAGNIYVYDMIQQLAIVEPEVAGLFRADTIEMGRGFLLNEDEWKDWILPDGTPCKIPGYVRLEKKGNDWFLLSADGLPVAVQKKGCLYFEQMVWPMAESDFEHDDFSGLDAHFRHVMWDAAPSPGGHLNLEGDDLLALKQGARQLRQSTDRAIIGLFGGNLFEAPQGLFGADRYFTYLHLYPEAVHRLTEKLTSLYLDNLEKWLGAVGDSIDIILFGDDLGSNMGPIISPEMYREYFKPFHKKLWNRARELSGVKVQLHCCGGVEPLLEDMIDAGLDAINPVQISARGMDPAQLKNKHGDRLCFWGGGCDTQRVLPAGSPSLIRQHTRELTGIWRKNGGYVFQPVHNIMADVPPENIVSAFAFEKEIEESIH